MNNVIEEKNSMSKYLFLAIIFVAVLIVASVASTYAYFQVTISSSITNSTLTTTTDCINVAISNDTTGNISLPFNYPVTDAYAMANITAPIVVDVKNSCSSNVSAVPYTLALTTLSKSGESPITNDKIRFHVKRKVGTADETVFKNNNYLTTLSPIASGTNNYTLINNDLNSKTATSSYTTRTIYTIDSTTIAANTTNTYKIYLWVDYYEGDTAMYNADGSEKSDASHTATYDNKTFNQTFKAAVSLVINSQ